MMKKKINKKLNNINQKIDKLNKNSKKTKRNRLKRKRKSRRGKLPAAITKEFIKEFRITNQTNNSMICKGRDLVYSIPSNSLIQNGDTEVIALIPCNPAYWLGTRVSAMASGYQNYRPLKFHCHYVPQCAVTQQGNVMAGTFWSMSPNRDNLQQTLRTSNGGMLVQCYKSGVSKVGLGKNLQYNLYRMGGKFDQESNPFIFMAISLATVDTQNRRIIPGYFYVDYKFEFKNPIGDTIKYFTSGLITNVSYDYNYVNETLINCNQGNINIGAIIQKDGSNFTWNDQPVTVNNNSLVWYFCNQVQLDSSGNRIAERNLEFNALSYEVGDRLNYQALSSRVSVYLAMTVNNAIAMYVVHGDTDYYLTGFPSNTTFYNLVLNATNYAVPEGFIKLCYYGAYVEIFIYVYDKNIVVKAPNNNKRVDVIPKVSYKLPNKEYVVVPRGPNLIEKSDDKKIEDQSQRANSQSEDPGTDTDGIENNQEN